MIYFQQEPEPSTTDEPTKDFGVNTEPVQTNDKESQTMYACKEKLAMKIDNVINRNSAEVPAEEKVLPQFCLEEISKNEKQFKFYTGLTIAQFEHLFSSLGESVNTLIYWRGEKRTNEKTPTPAKRPSEMKISPQEPAANYSNEAETSFSKQRYRLQIRNQHWHCL